MLGHSAPPTTASSYDREEPPANASLTKTTSAASSTSLPPKQLDDEKQHGLCDTPSEFSVPLTEEQLAEFGTKIDTTIPNGGWMAWMQVMGSWFAIVMTFGFSTGSGVVLNWLTHNYLKDETPSRVGWIFSIQLFLFYLMGVILGPIVDAYGARVLIIPGSIGWVAAIFILSACKEYYQFILCFSILGGFSSSLIFNPSVTLLTHWFSTHRGLVLGIAVSGSGVGGILFTQTFQHLVYRAGFGWAIRTMAFIVLFCAVVSSLTLRTRHVRQSINWEESKPDIRALKEPSFFFAVLGLFFVEWGIVVPVKYIISYAVAQGFSSAFGSNLISFLSTASVITRICVGQLSDYYGAFNLMVFFAALSGILSLAVWLPAGHHRGGLTAFCVLFGISSGATTSLAIITIPKLAHVQNAGRRYGTAYMVASVAVLTGIPLAGALTAHRYLGLVIFTGCTYLAGAVCFLISKHFAVGLRARF